MAQESGSTGINRAGKYAGNLAGALLLFALGLMTPAVAQSVQGRIIDESGRPLADVNIFVPGTEAGGKSASDGTFEIGEFVQSGMRLRFSIIGFETQEVVMSDITGDLLVVMVALTYQAPQVTIIADRDDGDIRISSRSLAVVSEGMLDRAQSHSLAALIAAVPGVARTGDGPASQSAVIRGLSGVRIAVWDGNMQSLGARWDSRAGYGIDPLSLSSVEVLRGPAVLEYGLGAVGGAVHVRRAALPSDPGISGGISTQFSSNNGAGAGMLSLAGKTSVPSTLAWHIEAGGRKAGDTRSPGHTLDNTSFESGWMAFESAYQHETLRLTLQGDASTGSRGLYSGAFVGNLSDLVGVLDGSNLPDDGSFDYSFRAPQQDQQRMRLSTQTELLFAQDWRASALIGYQQYRRKTFDQMNLLNEIGVPDDWLDEAFEGKLSFTRQKPTLLLSGGLHAIAKRSQNRGYAYFLPNYDRTMIAAYITPQWIVDDLIVDTGLRVESNRLSAFPFNRLLSVYEEENHKWSSSTVGFTLNYVFTPDWSASGGLTMAWRQPDVHELYSQGVSWGVASFDLGDPGLSSENSMNAEITIRHSGRRSRLEAGYFFHTISGFIHRYPTGTAAVGIRSALPTFQYLQTNAHLTGGEFSWFVALSEKWTSTLAASVVYGQDIDNDRPLYQIPPEQVLWNVQYGGWNLGPFTSGWAKLDIQATARQRRYPDDVEYAAPPDGFVLLGASAGANLSVSGTPVAFSVEIRNALNASYRRYLSALRYFVDEPGRDVWIRVHIPFGAT